mmetsp:Transcript_99422/g.237112  ORF Transcript_99422/g.237112 Transcript_99422/m.237112 type:complete len:203 (+) Transcript_99422:339-947(+)
MRWSSPGGFGGSGVSTSSSSDWLLLLSLSSLRPSSSSRSRPLRSGPARSAVCGVLGVPLTLLRRRLTATEVFSSDKRRKATSSPSAVFSRSTHSKPKSPAISKTASCWRCWGGNFMRMSSPASSVPSSCSRSLCSCEVMFSTTASLCFLTPSSETFNPNSAAILCSASLCSSVLLCNAILLLSPTGTSRSSCLSCFWNSWRL